MTYLVAHRGASEVAPENTLAAIRLAWEQEADAIEIDIHWTRDRKLVVIHDGNTRRTGHVRRSIAKSVWARLQEIDVGLHKSPAYAGEKIPLLEDVLATVPRGKKIYIEIKSKSRHLEVLDDCLTASGKRHQAVVIAFSLRQLARFKKLAPDVQVMWLRGPRVRKNPAGLDLINRGWIRRAIARGLDGLSVYHRDINPAFVARLREVGMKINAWTVRSPADARRMYALGVDSITADSLPMVRKAIGGNPAAS